MRRLLFVAAVLATAHALAGSRWKDNVNGSPPSTCNTLVSSAWVPLDKATGCRMSVRVDGGALAVQGKLVPYYCQEIATGTDTIRPAESAPANHCSIVAKLDGGIITDFVCPTLEPLASFGLVAATAYGISNFDGGAQNFTLRMECWGSEVPQQ